MRLIQVIIPGAGLASLQVKLSAQIEIEQGQHEQLSCTLSQDLTDSGRLPKPTADTHTPTVSNNVLVRRDLWPYK
jgi:hypothetical protein